MPDAAATIAERLARLGALPSWSKDPHDLTNRELADELRRLKRVMAAVDPRRDILEEIAIRLTAETDRAGQ